MNAFKDAGHHWWQRCPVCSMAWFIGDAPSDPDEEVECKRCREVDAALSAARDAALEEAIAWLAEHVGNDGDWLGAMRSALKSRPAERYLSEAKVRGVLVEVWTSTMDASAIGISTARASGRTDAVIHVAQRLGVDLDATPATVAPTAHQCEEECCVPK